jgi:hypothetical protein
MDTFSLPNSQAFTETHVLDVNMAGFLSHASRVLLAEFCGSYSCLKRCCFKLRLLPLCSELYSAYSADEDWPR